MPKPYQDATNNVYLARVRVHYVVAYAESCRLFNEQGEMAARRWLKTQYNGQLEEVLGWPEWALIKAEFPPPPDDEELFVAPTQALVDGATAELYDLADSLGMSVDEAIDLILS